MVAEDEARVQVPPAGAVGAEGVSDDEESGEINPELLPSSGENPELFQNFRSPIISLSLSIIYSFSIEDMQFFLSC